MFHIYFIKCDLTPSPSIYVSANNSFYQISLLLTSRNILYSCIYGHKTQDSYIVFICTTDTTYGKSTISINFQDPPLETKNNNSDFHVTSKIIQKIINALKSLHSCKDPSLPLLPASSRNFQPSLSWSLWHQYQSFCVFLYHSSFPPENNAISARRGSPEASLVLLKPFPGFYHISQKYYK